MRASRTDIARMSPKEKQRLVHELQVHQIEWNTEEELRRAQGTCPRATASLTLRFAPVATGPSIQTVRAGGQLTLERCSASNGLLARQIPPFVSRDSQEPLPHQPPCRRLTCNSQRSALRGGRARSSPREWKHIIRGRSGVCTTAARSSNHRAPRRSSAACNEERLRLAYTGLMLPGRWTENWATVGTGALSLREPPNSAPKLGDVALAHPSR